MLQNIEKLVGLKAPDPESSLFRVFGNNLPVQFIELDKVRPLKHEALKELFAVLVHILPIIKCFKRETPTLHFRAIVAFFDRHDENRVIE